MLTFLSSIMNISLQKYCLLAAYCIQSFLSAAVQAHGLHVDAAHGHDVGVVLSVEVLQIGQVLEVVGVHGAVLHHGVGHNVVIVDLNVQGDVLGRQDLLGDLQDLGVGPMWITP